MNDDLRPYAKRLVQPELLGVNRRAPHNAEGHIRPGVGHRAGRGRHPCFFTRRRNPAAAFPCHHAKTEEDYVQVTQLQKRPQ